MFKQVDGYHKIRSALFIDFDNIYIRLSQQDASVANQFATNPGQWLDWLEKRLPLDHIDRDAIARNILVRRCYLNPRSFQEYRPYFIRSAFEVIDCPPLTSQGKTSADIRMVMDMLGMLDHSTYFDEFIIFSGDADFTPVLLKLRRYDRRSVVLAIGPASPAYRAACDYLIEQDTFVEEAIGVDNQVPSSKQFEISSADADLLEKIAVYIDEVVREASAPIPMGKLAQQINSLFGSRISNTQWLGSGSFKNFLTQLDLGHLEISPIIPGYVYDPSKHPEPSQAGTTDEFLVRYPDLAPLAKKIHQLTETPYLMPHQYAVFLQEMAEEINENGYFLTRTSKAVRDRCLYKEVPIARSHVNFALRGIAFTGYRFGRDLETIESLGKALVANTINLCRAAQVELNDEEVEKVRCWIMGEAVKEANC